MIAAAGSSFCCSFAMLYAMKRRFDLCRNAKTTRNRRKSSLLFYFKDGGKRKREYNYTEVILRLIMILL